MKKNLIKFVIIEICCFSLQIIFSNINISNLSCVLSLPYAIVRLCFGGNVFCVLFEFAFAKFFSILTFADLFICFYEIVILTLFYFLKLLNLKTRPLLLLCLSVACSMALKCYYVLAFRFDLILFLVEFLVKIFATIFFYKFFKVFKNKFIFFKFSNRDYLYFSLICLLITLGIFSFPVASLYLEYFLLSVVLIIGSKIFPADKFLTFALAVGLGAFLPNFDVKLLTFVLFFCLVMVGVRERNKFIVSVFSLFPAVMIFLIFGNSTLVSLAVSALAVVIYLIMPQRKLLRISALFEINALNLINESLRQDKLFELKNKLTLMSNTLSLMQRDFKFLMVGKISKQKASEQFAQDVINRCCTRCENYKNCYCENINKRAMLVNLIAKALEVGDVSRDDLTQGMQTYCYKESIILAEINQLKEEFFKFEREVKSEDLSKLIVADELGNFAEIFSSFARQTSLDVGYNKRQSSLLKDRLLSNMFDVKDVAIVENSTGVETVNLIAANQHILKSELVSAISRFTKNNFALSSAKHLNFSGLSLAKFAPIDKLKMNIAVSSKAKEQKNGDNVSMCKLKNGKYFVALADGMGHGEAAGRVSAMVLSLVKSMFEIGFEENLVVESINKLILPAGLENFTTLDACVIDLLMEDITFVKLGASVSLIKKQSTSEVVSCSSLPMGVIENLRPTITKKHLSVGDTIILASDGIVDAFSSVDDYKTYVNDLKIFNLQKFVDDIVFDCEFQNKKHPDDMTIIAINLLKNF